MKKSKFFALAITALLAAPASLKSQELFVFTEPASNMPAKSIGIRAGNWIMPASAGRKAGYQLLPEIMWGVNKHLMIHLDGFFTNQGGSFQATGAGIYAKYRIYSVDAVNKHFRLAAFGRVSLNNSTVFQQEIDVARNNSGYNLGIIATQLLHKQAISGSVSYSRAPDHLHFQPFPPGEADQAINASISTGRLILPEKYLSYKQTNLNFMVEVLGQHLLASNRSFVDLAPAIQFIFNSQTRLDVGYKMQLYGDMKRVNQNAVMIRIEHLIFNVF